MLTLCEEPDDKETESEQKYEKKIYVDDDLETLSGYVETLSGSLDEKGEESKYDM